MKSTRSGDLTPARVLQIVDALEGGGAERVVVDLVKHIDRDKYAPLICTTREPGVYAPEVEREGIPVYCLHRKARFDPLGFLRLLRLISRTRPEIVHTHKVGSNTLGRAAAVLCRVPAIISHEHSTANRTEVQVIVDSILARITQMVITCDEALREALIAREFLDETGVITVHNGVEVKKFGSIICSTKEIRAELGLPDGSIVGTAARLDQQKDLPNLLEAVPYVLEEVPDTYFLIAGMGPLKGDLEAMAMDKGLRGAVRFLGYREDIPRLLSAFDIFVLSSIWEGLPISVLEAMAAGKPVVCTDVGGVSEVVDHGINGLLVPSCNPRELADALITLLKDPNKAREMGNRGHRKMQEEFSIETMVAKIEDLYSLALSPDKGS